MSVLIKYKVIIILFLSTSFQFAIAQKRENQKERNRENSEIVMTEEELESFLTKIAEKRKQQLSKQKAGNNTDPLMALWLSSQGDPYGQDLYYRELKLLHDKVDFLLAKQGYGNFVRPEANQNLLEMEQQLERLRLQAASSEGSSAQEELAHKIAALTAELAALREGQHTTASVTESSTASSEASRRHTLYFDNNSFRLSNHDLSALRDWVRESNLHQNSVIRLHGFASKVGNSEYNHKLSFSRANAVKEVLVQMGVDPSRILTLYHGEDIMKEDKLARRVELVISSP